MDTAEQTGCDDRDTFDRALDQAAEGLGLRVEPFRRTLMWAHFQCMLEANRQFNLTRITAPADAAVKHYADAISLLCIPGIEAAGLLAVLDVGTGAGFPAVPLAIMCPAWRITAIDGTAKKVRFVAQTLTALGLTNVEVIHARAADYARTRAQPFDLVLMRAVAKLAPALEEVHRLIAPGGQVVFYKTASLADSERSAGDRAARRRGLQPLEPVDVTLSSVQGPILRRFIRYRRGP